jgi:uncharacterized protein
MRQDLSPSLQKLEDQLFGLPDTDESMLLSELDGFLTGILVCPDLIMPGEWLPFVWGGDPENRDTMPAFEDIREFDAFCKLVIKHYNGIGLNLDRGPGHVSPIYDIDDRNGDVLWELWIAGFAKAMKLRPGSWVKIAESGNDAAVAALASIVAFIEIDNRESAFPKEKIEELILRAPQMIPSCIDALYAWRAGRDMPKPPVAVHAKTGRNDPCHCGSGRKYKKCCGAN